MTVSLIKNNVHVIHFYLSSSVFSLFFNARVHASRYFYERNSSMNLSFNNYLIVEYILEIAFVLLLVNCTEPIFYKCNIHPLPPKMHTRKWFGQTFVTSAIHDIMTFNIYDICKWMHLGKWSNRDSLSFIGCKFSLEIRIRHSLQQTRAKKTISETSWSRVIIETVLYVLQQFHWFTLMKILHNILIYRLFHCSCDLLTVEHFQETLYVFSLIILPVYEPYPFLQYILRIKI